MTSLPITAKTFFNYYIIHPGSKKLTSADQKTAKLCSVILGVCTIGLIHLGVLIYRLGCALVTVLKDDGIEKITTISSLSNSNLNVHQRVNADPVVKKEEAAPPRFDHHVLNSLAQAYGEKAQKFEESFTMKGIPNLGNTCYFNSALQNLEAMILSMPAGEQLLRSDLSLRNGETTQDIENRLLYSFCPVGKIKIKEDVEQDGKLANDEEAYQAFKEKTLKARREMALPEHQLHLNLKWSLLVLLQVKQFGTSKELKLALEAHRDLFFDQQDNDFIAENREKQLDSSDYIRLILNALRLNCPVFIASKMGKNPINVEKTVYPFLDLKPSFEPEPKEEFSILLKKLFMPEEVESESGNMEDVCIKRMWLSKNLPPVLTVRIDRNFLGLVHQELVVNEMVPVRNDNSVILKKREIRKVLNTVQMRAKNNSIIHFDLDPQKIDLGSFVKGKEKNAELYKIAGVNIHLGDSENNGHYISYIRKAETWFRIDDEEVVKLSKEELPPFGSAAMLTLIRVEPLKEC